MLDFERENTDNILKKKYLTEINLWYPTYQMLLLWGIIRHCLLIQDMQM